MLVFHASAMPSTRIEQSYLYIAINSRTNLDTSSIHTKNDRTNCGTAYQEIRRIARRISSERQLQHIKVLSSERAFSCCPAATLNSGI